MAKSFWTSSKVTVIIFSVILEVILWTWSRNKTYEVKIVKNKEVKSEYTKQNMAVVKKNLNLLEEKELTEEVERKILKLFKLRGHILPFFRSFETLKIYVL